MPICPRTFAKLGADSIGKLDVTIENQHQQGGNVIIDFMLHASLYYVASYYLTLYPIELYYTMSYYTTLDYGML